ncbi:MAG: hypothetical protein HYT40_01880 [Candidatus Sungbacteria bacterium]|uniref:Peptidase A2 domain-containing protein n=1 Tax=Candidatus Sungiibacteriota bacterium TaxID=2750080 RepID=A0A931SDV0_9BACT|nr:hypothetical protein [Candidatus Sungbacteria bacterium]
MHGYFDAKDGRPKVSLKIKGRKGEKVISALFDTGSQLALSLPLIDLIEIGAEISGVEGVTYADRRTGAEYLFDVKVMLDGRERDVQANLIPDPSAEEAIIGTPLFDPYVVVIDFKNKSLGLLSEEEIAKLDRKKTPKEHEPPHEGRLFSKRGK